MEIRQISMFKMQNLMFLKKKKDPKTISSYKYITMLNTVVQTYNAENKLNKITIIIKKLSDD